MSKSDSFAMELWESRRGIGRKRLHDSDKASIPSYRLDAPLFREAWSPYYDVVTQVDYRAGEVIAAPKEDGLWEGAIVIVWADDAVGIPRGKNTAGKQGTDVQISTRSANASGPSSWNSGPTPLLGKS